MAFQFSLGWIVTIIVVIMLMFSEHVLSQTEVQYTINAVPLTTDPLSGALNVTIHFGYDFTYPQTPWGKKKKKKKKKNAIQ